MIVRRQVIVNQINRMMIAKASKKGNVSTYATATVLTIKRKVIAAGTKSLCFRSMNILMIADKAAKMKSEYAERLCGQPVFSVKLPTPMRKAPAKLISR